jgi:lysozyme family protein
VDDAHLIEAALDMTTIVDDEGKTTVARTLRAPAQRASAAEGRA